MNEYDRLYRQAQRYKELYPKGTRILLLHMGNDPRPVEDNMRGTVITVDDMSAIHCKFDNGRQLGIIPGEDSFRKLTDEEVYTSPDFQCDQTGGFPTSLCILWEKQKAWLELKENLLTDRDDMELGYYRDLCADYGIRSCCDIEDFNSLLCGLGEDAIRTAELFSDEDESITMGGM